MWINNNLRNDKLSREIRRSTLIPVRAMSGEVTKRIRERHGLKNFKQRWSEQPQDAANGKEKDAPSCDLSTVQPSEDEEVERGALKRLSTMWSSFRGKLNRDRVKEPCQESLDSAPVDTTAREQRYMSGQYFFEYLVVVSLKKSKEGAYEPQITYQFPKRDGMVRFQREEEEKTLKAITLFCFPEGISWAPLTEYHSETFSFVLTEIDGSRRNGYCRRLLPHGNGARPPEAFCIISSLACFGLFSKIISLTRPVDSWLEHVDFRTLFRCLTNEEVVLVFAAAVMERRIVFIAVELSTLSQVIHAVAALLYPFIWQHTFISIVPEILIDVVMAPTPYLLGVQKRLMEQVTDQTDLLVVDLSEDRKDTFLVQIGDEKSILPPKLQDEILQALRNRKEKATVEELNRVVSEAFLPFFVKTVGHFALYVTRNSSGQPGVFQSRAFYKAIKSNTTRHFVKKFLQTQMFDLFIQEVEQQPASSQQGIFHKKIVEYQEQKRKEKTKKRH
ncbi:DENN domain-containing protein 2D-like isoform X5 [Salvelinus alpinus]|uniref:DENN domain-containing protein 2D-like isoform X5 n=1 Tax=Salvelinus alpinus TaxID=8036 RepID=UPI0039FCBF02